jgi:antitoxin component YwqK of YwqJK toxin-antitoxin module
MTMRPIFFTLLILFTLQGHSQWKDYTIGVKGDTLNCVDRQNRKQGKWVNHFDEVRGEPGYEEEGSYKDSRKEGPWRLYTLNGDLEGVEYYKWGNKDGICQYFTPAGELLREEGWKALNPDKLYDTLVVEDIDKPDSYKTVIVKNEGAALKQGEWKFFNPATGAVLRIETYTLGKLESRKIAVPVTDTTGSAAAKPKEVLDFEKKTGKKKVKVQDGSAGY